MKSERLRARRGICWMLLGSSAFAVMAALTHALGPRCDWRIVAFGRTIFMFAAAVVLARAAGVALAFWKPRTLWIRSVAGSFSLVCNFFAMTRLPVSTALVLSQTNPIWIALLSPFVLGRGPGLLEMAGIACGMVGVLLVQPPRGGETAAVLVALLSALATAIAMLGLHRLRSVDPRAIVAHFAGVAAVVAGLSLVLFPGAMRESPGIGDRVTWLLLLGVGISGTIGQVCLTKAYATGPPATVAVAGLAQVAFAIPFDLLIWRRAVTPLAALGFVLVLAPSAFLAIRGRMTRGEELAIPSEPTPG